MRTYMYLHIYRYRMSKIIRKSAHVSLVQWVADGGRAKRKNRNDNGREKKMNQSICIKKNKNNENRRTYNSYIIKYARC